MKLHDPASRILYVDDEPEVGEAFARAVNRLGFEVDVASSGDDALRMARTRYYPVIVTDLRMPGLDGLSLVERLTPIVPTTAFVLVTGLANFDLRSSRSADGAIASVINKPFDDDELMVTLSRAFQLHAQRKGNDDAASSNKAALPSILLVETATPTRTSSSRSSPRSFRRVASRASRGSRTRWRRCMKPSSTSS